VENIKLKAGKGEKRTSNSRETEYKLLRVRKRQKRKKPHFIQEESWRYKRIDALWRRPKGIDSKMRLKKKSGPKSVAVGYRSPRLIRTWHPSGFKEVLVHNVREAENMNPDHVVRISRTVGLKKRLQIIERTRELGLRVLNTRGVDEGEPEESEKVGI
jgi:large subunit ribosomal protein L32e